MKRIILLCIAALMLVLTGCAGGREQQPQETTQPTQQQPEENPIEIAATTVTETEDCVILKEQNAPDSYTMYTYQFKNGKLESGTMESTFADGTQAESFAKSIENLYPDVRVEGSKAVASLPEPLIAQYVQYSQEELKQVLADIFSAEIR